MVTKNKIDKNKIIVNVDNDIYSKKTILNCAYSMSSDYKFDIISSKRFYKIIITPIKKKTLSELNKALNQFEVNLIDFQLRDIIYRETKNIRELIIAKAFSHYNE